MVKLAFITAVARNDDAIAELVQSQLFDNFEATMRYQKSALAGSDAARTHPVSISEFRARSRKPTKGSLATAQPVDAKNKTLLFDIELHRHSAPKECVGCVGLTMINKQERTANLFLAISGAVHGDSDFLFRTLQHISTIAINEGIDSVLVAFMHPVFAVTFERILSSDCPQVLPSDTLPGVKTITISTFLMIKSIEKFRGSRMPDEPVVSAKPSTQKPRLAIVSSDTSDDPERIIGYTELTTPARAQHNGSNQPVKMPAPLMSPAPSELSSTEEELPSGSQQGDLTGEGDTFDPTNPDDRSDLYDRDAYHSSGGANTHHFRPPVHHEFDALCRFWQAGACKFGSSCRFLHVGLAGELVKEPAPVPGMICPTFAPPHPPQELQPATSTAAAVESIAGSLVNTASGTSLYLAADQQLSHPELINLWYLADFINSAPDAWLARLYVSEEFLGIQTGQVITSAAETEPNTNQVLIPLSHSKRIEILARQATIKEERSRSTTDPTDVLTKAERVVREVIGVSPEHVPAFIAANVAVLQTYASERRDLFFSMQKEYLSYLHYILALNDGVAKALFGPIPNVMANELSGRNAAGRFQSPPPLLVVPGGSQTATSPIILTPSATTIGENDTSTGRGGGGGGGGSCSSGGSTGGGSMRAPGRSGGRKQPYQHHRDASQLHHQQRHRYRDREGSTESADPVNIQSTYYSVGHAEADRDTHTVSGSDYGDVTGNRLAAQPHMHAGIPNAHPPTLALPLLTSTNDASQPLHPLSLHHNQAQHQQQHLIHQFSPHSQQHPMIGQQYGHGHGPPPSFPAGMGHPYDGQQIPMHAHNAHMYAMHHHHQQLHQHHLQPGYSHDRASTVNTIGAEYGDGGNNAERSGQDSPADQQPEGGDNTGVHQRWNSEDAFVDAHKLHQMQRHYPMGSDGRRLFVPPPFQGQGGHGGVYVDASSGLMITAPAPASASEPVPLGYQEYHQQGERHGGASGGRGRHQHGYQRGGMQGHGYGQVGQRDGRAITGGGRYAYRGYSNINNNSNRFGGPHNQNQQQNLQYSTEPLEGEADTNDLTETPPVTTEDFSNATGNTDINTNTKRNSVGVDNDHVTAGITMPAQPQSVTPLLAPGHTPKQRRGNRLTTNVATTAAAAIATATTSTSSVAHTLTEPADTRGTAVPAVTHHPHIHTSQTRAHRQQQSPRFHHNQHRGGGGIPNHSNTILADESAAAANATAAADVRGGYLGF